MATFSGFRGSCGTGNENGDWWIPEAITPPPANWSFVVGVSFSTIEPSFGPQRQRRLRIYHVAVAETSIGGPRDTIIAGDIRATDREEVGGTGRRRRNEGREYRRGHDRVEIEERRQLWPVINRNPGRQRRRRQRE